MAIYHFSAQVASRSAGRSAVAMAAYRSGQRLKDERTGETKHYRRAVKPENIILAPVHSPAWIHKREKLWNEVEKAEKRKDAQLCREINIAIPKEFSPELQTKIVLDYCKREFVDMGMVADVAIHRDDPNNPHAHVMLTMRDITPEGFGNKNRSWNERELLEKWREQWAQEVNRVFEKAQRSERIDHKSFERQGIQELLPTIHEGPTVREMENRGQLTDRAMINRSIRAHNALVIDLDSYRKEREALKQQIAAIPPRSYEKVWEECLNAQRKRDEAKEQAKKLENKLQRIKDLQQLQEKKEKYKTELEQLKPKTLWQKLTNGNKEKIERLERYIEQIDLSLNELPSANEIQRQLADLATLRGTIQALEKAHRDLDQEYTRMRQERIQENLKKEMTRRSRSRDRGHDLDR